MEKAYKSENFQNWYNRWQLRLKTEEQGLNSSLDLMRSVNPAVIPRNHKSGRSLTSW